MKNLTPILYGVILCALLVFAIKLSTPNVPEGMALIPAGDGVDAFYMDTYEVTNAQYRKFIDENPQWQKNRALTSIVGDGYLSGWNGNLYPKGKANHPVVNIGWFAAKAYTEWAGKELPTEAQWERAARGTLEGKKYPWGNAKPRKRANYNRYTPITNFRNPPTKEVTNAQYRKFIDENPQWQKNRALTSVVGDGYLSGWNGNLYPKGKANHPVVNIGWFAAKAYAEWAGKELPTEAQWERAARGTLEGKKYPWGNAKPRKRANYNRYTPITNFRNPPTKEVGSYAPNAYGLYDMAGNVEEWCLERLDVEDIHGRYHRMRGGSWFDSAEEIQITTQSQHPVDDGMATLGFRCVLPKTETKSIKVATDMAAWLFDEMCGQFDSAFYSVSKGYTAHVNLDAKLADIVMFNTGYPQTFEKELIRVLREVGPEGIEDMPYEEPIIYHDLTLRLWRLYLEVHFEHSNENIYEKLRLFKERVTENIDDIILSDAC